MAHERYMIGLAAGAIATGLLGLPARAQNAMGDGRGQERSLEYGSGGRLSPIRRDIYSEYRLRNSIVTGNAPGGLSFRGDLGYTAAGDFRGQLGSNDLFDFRRDSLESGLSGMGIRGTEALQYQFGLTTGNRFGTGPQGPLYVQRFGSAQLGQTRVHTPSTAGTLRESTGILNLPSRSARDPRFDENLDRRGLDLWVLRSPSAYVASRAIQPTLLGVRPGPDQKQYGLTASELLGVRFVPLGDNPESGTPREDEPTTPPAGTALPPAGPSPEQNGNDQGDAHEPVTAYEMAVQRMETRLNERMQTSADPSNPSPAGDQGQSWRQQIASLRKQLMNQDTARGELAPNQLDQSGDRAEAGSSQGSPLSDPLGQAERSSRIQSGNDPARPNPGFQVRERVQNPAQGLMPTLEQMGIDPSIIPKIEDDQTDEVVNLFDGNAERDRSEALRKETVELLKALAIRVDRLTPEVDASPGSYEDHMNQGQAFLAQDRYFDAEERFSRALAVRPGDVMAGVGRVHAQLGGGLFLSAATNLRALLLDHPEAMALRYGNDLIPSKERIKTVAKILRANAADPAQALAVESGMLLAYLGYQTDNPQMVQEGLDLWDRAEVKVSADHARDRLVELARAVWTRAPGDSDQPGPNDTNTPGDAASGRVKDPSR